MIKVSFFRGQDAQGVHVLPLFGPADSVFEKTAAPSLLPDVARYIANLRPSAASQYVLLNALGAGEFWGSNANGDYFPEAALLHKPDDWKGVALYDEIRAKDWPYGFPTFYNAKPFLHHRNKDFAPHNHPSYGKVEFAAWNDKMKRVELVARIDKELCQRFGGTSIWDKLKEGQYPSVSMGTKVPFDTCFTAGTLVRTAQGQKPIESIRVGDKVLTHKGRYRTVTQVMSRRADTVLRIKVSGLPRIKATETHPFLVLRKEQVRTCKGSANGMRLRHSFRGSSTCYRCEKKPEFTLTWTSAESIRPGDYLTLPVPKPVRSRDDVTLARARLLGYYLGNGYIVKQRTGKKKNGEYRDMGVGFSFGSANKENLKRLLDTLAAAEVKNVPRVYDAGCGRKAYIITVYDQNLAAWVQEKAGRTSHHKKIAEDVYRWSKDAKLELVAGYIDTDGCFDERGSVRIGSVNRGLLLDVQRLLLLEGIIATVCFAGSAKDRNFKSEHDAWYLSLSAFQAQRFLGRAVKVTAIDVSWEAPESFFWEGQWFTPVERLEAVKGDVDVFNLSVTEDESYIAEGMSVHNCSVCIDHAEYNKALATFVPGKHKSPGEAALQYHRAKKLKDRVGVRGLAVTRADYCEHALKQMNHIAPNGKKTYVVNDFPRFFDISFVFIGADKTARVMFKIADEGESRWTVPSTLLAEKLGYVERPVVRDYARHAALNLGMAVQDIAHFNEHPDANKIAPKGTVRHLASSLTSRLPSLTSNFYYAVLPPTLHHTDSELAGLDAGTAKDWFLNGYDPNKYDISDDTINAAIARYNKQRKEKTASVDALEAAFLGKKAEDKHSELTKHVVPSQFAGKAVPLLTKNEPSLPSKVLDVLGASPFDSALSTATGMGMVLRPREFQRIVLIRMRMKPLADEMDCRGEVFPEVAERSSVPMGLSSFSEVLARILMPFLQSRCGLGPIIEKRVLMMSSPSVERGVTCSSLPSDLLHKISATYNGYRDGVMELVAHAPELITSVVTTTDGQLRKFASSSVEEVFTPLSAAYFKLAFLDEFGVNSYQAFADAEKVLPSRNAENTNSKLAGGR